MEELFLETLAAGRENCYHNASSSRVPARLEIIDRVAHCARGTMNKRKAPFLLVL
jgi:hypothetical protein